ncbi:MAG: RNA polymerase sigma factor [Planctomycetes bacterium]|nr:RNA polymerase sigma factor [Planctomycetota bacterium]
MPAALDPDTFASAFARNGRTLWVIASAWVGRDEADDLVQEVARVAWQRREQFADGEPGPQLGNWLAAIARNLGANWRRRRRPELFDPDALPDVVATTVAQADWPFDADRAGLSDELANALARLPEVARATLLLHVVLGHPFAEIAAMLGINENTAQSHARRARIALREAMTPARER